MARAKLLFFSCIFLFLIVACAPKEESEGNYEKTKNMVVDILKTDEGKKALQEMLADEKTKELLIMNDDVVKATIKQTLLSEDGLKFWNEQFKDPKFVETFAKSIQEQNKQLQKDLMKDPDYQEAMIEILQDPEMEKQLTKLLKSKEYRKHLQTVIIETLESPLYKTQLMEILTKVVEEVIKSGKASEDSGGQGGSEESE
ncbi:spore gernimation protein GerD [Lottiidibacillus patelloidae]|uniref:Spore gernimation protein GerD n=1 Tax=Lottiidibacillus patelloidae TaxID=2670334 RepID=A0A263BQD8_9BACI|nr:spore germination lipoprotein GerD [Lottiidibacillus patelloidae]OZM55951.1 spore gernimation protein GerD [Lottiidibacillus patelloidae]